MTIADGPDIAVHASAQTLPEALRAAAPAFAAAATSGLSLKLVTAPRDEAGQRARAKRRHDLKGAVRTLGYAVQSIQAGYKFDDERAAQKIAAIAKAVQVLEREAELLAKLAYEDQT